MQWRYLLFLFAMIPGLAAASVEGLYYLDAEGQRQDLGSDKKFVNVTTKLGGFVRGGLDRKVGLNVLDADGNVTDSVMSDLIGVEDTKVVNGQARYGFDLEIDIPIIEGEFTLQSVIYTAIGEVVETTDRSIVVDTTPIDFGVPTHIQYRRYKADQWNVVSSYGGGPDMRADFTWDGAPPSKAEIAMVARADGSNTTLDVPVTSSGIDYHINHGHFKHRESWYDMKLTVWDEAGNKHFVDWEAKFDGQGRPFNVVGVYDPSAPESEKQWKHISGLEHYIPYTPGMKIGAGRTRLLTTIKKSDHFDYNEFGNYGAGSCCTEGYFDWNKKIYHEEDGMLYNLTGWRSLTTHAPANHNAQAGSIGADGAIWRTTVSLGVKDDARVTLKPGGHRKVILADGSIWNNGVYLNATHEQVQVGVQGYLNGPVSEDVHVNFLGVKTLVPAGQTEFEVRSPNGSRGTWVPATICYAEGEPMCSDVFHSTIYRNTTPPRLDGWEYKGVTAPGRHEYEIEAWSPYGTTSSWLRMKSGHIALVNTAGDEVYRKSRFYQSNSAANYIMKFDVSDIPTGEYDVKIILEDRVGNITEEVIERRFFDLDNPSVNFFAGDAPWNGEDIGKLSDIGIQVVSNGSPAVIESIMMIGGAANDNYVLAWRTDGELSRLEYPLMFPSRVEGEEYTLKVKVVDEQKNSATYERTFAFKPRTTVVNGDVGVLIPAIPESIEVGNLPPIYSEPVKLDESTLVVGVYDLVVTLRSDSDFGVNILGYELEPGDTKIIDKYDFDANGSRVALPVFPTSMVVGQANLLISPAAPGSDYVLADITTWKPNPVVMVNEQPFGDGLKIEQALENVSISVVAGPGDMCTYTSNEEEILASNPMFDPVCTVVWDLPNTIQWDDEAYSAKGYLVGEEEDAEIGYQIFIPRESNIHGTEVASDRAVIDVVHPDLAFDFDPNYEVTRHITEFMKLVVNTGSAKCDPTVNPADARLGTKYGYPKCLIEWNLVPDGVATSIYTPMVQGIAEKPEAMEFTFDVTYFDQEQNPYLLPEQSITVPVKPPKPVEITLPKSEYDPATDGTPRYFVGVDGEYIGTAVLTGSGADIDMEYIKNGTAYQSLPYRHRGGRDRDTDYQFRIWMEDLELWEASRLEVKGAYQLMPEINDAKEATIIGVPSTQIRARMELEGRKLLDTDEVEVKVYLDGRAVLDGYKPDIHGKWKVQIQYEMRNKELEYLTDWEPLGGDGSITTSIKLGDRQDGYMYAVVRLDSPFEEYTRELKSNRNFVNVLRGGAIDGKITSTSVTGRSVFTAFLRIQVEDRNYQYSLGDVDWLISQDGGATYDPVEEGARGNYMRGDFAAGRYLVKARLHNKHTDIVSETEVQEIHVYDVPEVKIEGPQNTFKSQPAELHATATLDREPVPIENYYVEWSDDGGETWEERLTYVASFDGENDRMRYRVRVRDMDAPMHLDGIHRERSHRLNFIDPEGPRTRIYGSRRLERGDPGEYRVDLSPPRSGMDVEMAGEWILPDGTIIEGDDPITYNPSEDDVKDGRVSIVYRSWVKGFRDQGAESEREHRISAWQYVWPEWDVFANTGALEAPAEIRLTPRTPGWFGWLDDEQYEWTFPAGTELVYDNEKRPTIRIQDAGEHNIRLLISDARGNETEVVKTLSLVEPAPAEIEFGYYTGNKYMRAPLEVRPRIYLRGGHRLDRIQDREILINGKSLIKGSRISSFVIEEPGTYSVTAKVYSKMGRVVETTEEIKVVPNQPPVCAPVANDKYGYLIVEANCSDEDGRIVETRWEMDGEELPSNSYKYRFTSSQLEKMGGSVQIQVSAKDDAGAYSQKHTVNYTAK